MKQAWQHTVHHVHPMDTWTLTLNRYQRDNLLFLLNVCGYPFGNPHIIRDMDFNTGDWIGELVWMLAKKESSGDNPREPMNGIIDEDDQPNGLPWRLRENR